MQEPCCHCVAFHTGASYMVIDHKLFTPGQPLQDNLPRQDSAGRRCVKSWRL